MNEIFLNLSKKNANEYIQAQLYTEDRFVFLENLRRSAIQSYRADGLVNDYIINLKDVESKAMLYQFETIDKALVGVLRIENRESSYTNYSRDDDPDLPDDPDSLSDKTAAFRYALKRLYRRQFEVSLNEQKNGCWPLIIYDLLDPIDGKRNLLINQIPQAVTGHASTDFLNNLASQDLRTIKQTLLATQADLAHRLEIALRQSGSPHIADVSIMGKIQATIKVLRVIIEVIGGIEAVNDAVLFAKEQWEKFEREQKEAERREQERKAKQEWEKFHREPREIPHSSDHVDRFERNRDVISRTC